MKKNGNNNDELVKIAIKNSQSLLEHSKPREAIKWLNKAIKLNPKHEQAYFERGKAKMLLNSTKSYFDAIKDYDKAIQINPLFIDAYKNRAKAFESGGNFKSADADYTVLIKFHNVWKLIEIYEARGNLRFEYGAFQDAINDFTFVIDHAENIYTRSDAYENRGNAKYMIKDFIGAIEDYSKVLELNAHKFFRDKILRKRGSAKVFLGDNIGAIKDCTNAINLESKDAKAYNFRGLAKNNIGDYDGAISDLNTAIEIEKEYVIAYHNRSLVQKNIGNYEAENQDIQLAKEYSRLDIVRNLNYIETLLYKKNGLIKLKIIVSFAVAIGILMMVLAFKVDTIPVIFRIIWSFIGLVPLVCIMPIINTVDAFSDEKRKLSCRRERLYEQSLP